MCKIKVFVRDLIAELFYLLQAFILWIPFWPIRWVWLKIFLKHFGKGTYIARNVDIRKPWNITIGNHSVVNKNALLDGRGLGLVIGDNVDIAQEAMIWSLTHDVKSPTHSVVKRLTVIGDHTWICTRSILNAGTTVSRGAVIGAGSVVSHDVPEKAIMIGNPAIMLKQRENGLGYSLRRLSLF